MFRSLYQVMEVTIVTKTLPICHSDFRAGEELFFRSRKKKHYGDHILPKGRLICGEHITWTYQRGSTTHGKKSLQ